MAKKVRKSTKKLRFRDALLARRTVFRALKVCSIVGTILLLINQGDLIALGEFPPLWKILLTYMVPYCVSSYTTAMLLIEFNATCTSPLDARA